jgi:hypothetical protein
MIAQRSPRRLAKRAPRSTSWCPVAGECVGRVGSGLRIYRRDDAVLRRRGSHELYDVLDEDALARDDSAGTPDDREALLGSDRPPRRAGLRLLAVTALLIALGAVLVAVRPHGDQRDGARGPSTASVARAPVAARARRHRQVVAAHRTPRERSRRRPRPAHTTRARRARAPRARDRRPARGRDLRRRGAAEPHAVAAPPSTRAPAAAPSPVAPPPAVPVPRPPARPAAVTPPAVRRAPSSPPPSSEFGVEG